MVSHPTTVQEVGFWNIGNWEKVGLVTKQFFSILSVFIKTLRSIGKLYINLYTNS